MNVSFERRAEMMRRKNMNRSAKGRAAVKLAVAGFVAGFGGAASGQTWNNFVGTNNFNVGSNWLEGTVPVSGATTVLNFGGSGADSYTAVQNISNPFIVNKINLTSSASGPVIIGGTVPQTAANTIRFSGVGAAVNHTGSGDVTLNAPLQHNADVTYNVAGPGRLIILGNYTQTGGEFGLTKTGPGILQWGGPERGIGNSLAGDINVLEGTIVLANSAGSFLSNNGIVTIASGATFDFANNAEDFGSLQGGGTLAITNANANIGLDNGSTTWSGDIAGTSATNTISKEGTGTWTIISPQSYVHRTQVDGGTLVLSGDGSIVNSSRVTVNAGNSLVLDSSGTNNTNRLPDAGPVILGGNSSVTLIGNGAAETTESMGDISITGPVTLTVRPGTGQHAALLSNSLTRNAGATILFRGPNLGGAAGADTANVLFNFAPGLTGGNGPAGSPSVSILPYALGDTSLTGTGSSLVTYDAVTGIRPLDINTEFSPYDTAQPTDNAKITAGATGVTGKRVNALLVQNTGTTPMAVTGAAGNTLNVDGGAVLFTGTAPITLGGFDNLSFDFGEGIISVANTSPDGVTISNPIFATGGITKGGSGLLNLTGSNVHQLSTAINAGTLRVSSDANLGDTSARIDFNVGTLQAGASFETFRPINISTGGIATFDTNGNDLTLSGTMGGAGTLVKKGAGTLSMVGLGSYTRGTNIDQGVLEIAAGNSIGTGAITFNGGTLRAKAGSPAIDTTTNRAIVFNLAPGNTIHTNGVDMTTGAMSGPGGFTKVGAGVLNINSANTFAGDMFIREGTVRPPTGAGSWVSDFTYIDIAAGATLDANDNAEQFGGISGAGTINIGVNGANDVHVLGTRDSTFSGVIQGAGFLRKNGPHTLTLTGTSSTFTGRTEVWAGKLVVNANVLPDQPGPLGQSSVPIMLGRNTLADESNLIIGNSGVEIGRTISLVSGSSGVSRLGSSHTSGVSKISGGVELFKAVELTAETGGTLEVSGVVSGTEGITKVGGGTVKLTAANTYAGPTIVRQGTLRVDGSISQTSGLTVRSGGVAELGATQVVGSLTVEPGGKLDLTDEGVIVNYATGGTPADVRPAIIAGRAGGAWNGNGITSSGIAGRPGTAIGYGESSDVLGPAGGPFMGVPVDGDATLVRFTLSGDSDLNGVVDFNDLARLAQNYNVSDGSRVWTQGDYTYDGNVDFNDLALMAQNYNTVLAPGQAAALGADLAGDWEAATAQVPEPGLAMAALVGLVTLRRRRR
jgi:autotransporter-associated beta strand protein